MPHYVKRVRRSYEVDQALFSHDELSERSSESDCDEWGEPNTQPDQHSKFLTLPTEVLQLILFHTLIPMDSKDDELGNIYNAYMLLRVSEAIADHVLEVVRLHASEAQREYVSTCCQMLAAGII